MTFGKGCMAVLLTSIKLIDFLKYYIIQRKPSLKFWFVGTEKEVKRFV